jgi:hypothetical protein
VSDHRFDRLASFERLDLERGESRLRKSEHGDK